METLGIRRHSPDKIISMLSAKKDPFWTKEGKAMSLSLFHEAAKRVPAYADFLDQNGVSPERIQSYRDFQSIPSIDKKNYLRKYPLEQLCWDNSFQGKSMVFTCTSGSTGMPFYFPRDDVLDLQSSVAHESFIRHLTGGRDVSTLVVNSFGMGVWIGGLITYQAFRNLALRGYPITIITPGANKKEIFDALKHVGGKFDRIVLCGYPPFIKNIIDEGETEGIPWKELNIKLLFAAEAFGEKFRNYVIKKTGITDVYRDIANIYGTADMGTMAQETPVSILIRRLAVEKRRVFAKVFPGTSKIPTLAQFNPMFINFETDGEKVLCTGYNALPLIRYAIGDHGGVVTFNAMRDTLNKEGIDILAEAERHGLSDTISELPFVYVYERSDLSTKLYGAIIYPEHVREAILHESLEECLTGKFTLVTKHDKNQNEYLEINCEMKKGMQEQQKLRNRVITLVVDSLLEKNAEYHYLSGMMPERVVPRVTFWEYEHPQYFQVGAKQKWVLA